MARVASSRARARAIALFFPRSRRRSPVAGAAKRRPGREGSLLSSRRRAQTLVAFLIAAGEIITACGLPRSR